MHEVFSFLTDRCYVFGYLGIGLVIFAGLCGVAGEAPVRYGGWAYRDEEPKRFWRRVLGYFIAGLFFIGLSSIGFYLSKNPN
jgi:hypothetical protein